MAEPSAIDDEAFLLFLAASEEESEQASHVVIDPLTMAQEKYVEKDNSGPADKEHKDDE